MSTTLGSIGNGVLFELKRTFRPTPPKTKEINATRAELLRRLERLKQENDRWFDELEAYIKGQ